MHNELHGNVVHQGIEFLLLVSMLFLLAIPKSFLILKEFLYTSTIIMMSQNVIRSYCKLCCECMTYFPS